MPLSSEQSAIVVHPIDKHAVVLAVAGSGKSFTMIERIAYLIEAKRVDPAHLIAVMFNKAASEEMSDKLAKRLGKRNSPLSVTYHRLGTLTLKRLVASGLAPAWEFDANPNRARYFTAKVIQKECEIRGHKYPNLVADAFLGFIDRVKSDLLTPGQVWANGDWPSQYIWFIDYFAIFEKARASAELRFFSDLIYDPVMIMKSNPKAAAAAADRYKHIIVDEYQDICEAQQALIRFTAGSVARVMVVGDDDQTIYTWRGAKPSYILRDFLLDFPGAISYRLTRTWRYGHSLSCAANYVITNNTDRADKLCISGDQAPVTSLTLLIEHPKTNPVKDTINREITAGRKLNDIVLLARAYSHTASAQFSLLESCIPFRLEGGDNASVLDNPWIVSLLGWMGIASGRIAPRAYVGEPDMKSIFELRKIIQCPPFLQSFEHSKQLCACVLNEPDEGRGFATFTSSHLKRTDGLLSEKLHEKRLLWNKLRALTPKAKLVNPYKLLDSICSQLDIETLIKNSMSSAADADDAISLVLAFKNYVKEFGGLSLLGFLNHIDDLRSFSDRAKSSTDAIHITSIHRSKGLEWPVVVMIGLSQGRFPMKMKAPKDKVISFDMMSAHLEDERRLFYVGMTRVREKLFLVCPPDDILANWLKGGSAGSPPLTDDGTRASQFVYESNLFLSSNMHRQVIRPSPLMATDPSIFNDYLECLGMTHRAIKA
ncbi:hypothetical protein LCGC14_0328120 [marine sediment metagenome]|uniref:DNA 3'-5' helicase n=1 Tax=marine sediment metagenome TaxID=412755 RepID=A0A0F9WPF4_9ZZZZ